MKMKEIMESIKMLASGQGMYGRMYDSIMSLPRKQYDELAHELESHNFEDIVDFVLWVES